VTLLQRVAGPGEDRERRRRRRDRRRIGAGWVLQRTRDEPARSAGRDHGEADLLRADEAQCIQRTPLQLSHFTSLLIVHSILHPLCGCAREATEADVLPGGSTIDVRPKVSLERVKVEAM
jgi:hypothetical protein